MNWLREEPSITSRHLVAAPLQEIRILLVEDEGFVRDVAAEILLSAGYKVMTARTGAEAMREFLKRQEPIELLITDVVLPGKNGYLVSQELTNICPAMKTIFMSGYPEKAAAGERHRNLYYLAKPFSIDSLMLKVEQVLNTNHQPVQPTSA